MDAAQSPQPGLTGQQARRALRTMQELRAALDSPDPSTAMRALILYRQMTANNSFARVLSPDPLLDAYRALRSETQCDYSKLPIQFLALLDPTDRVRVQRQFLPVIFLLERIGQRICYLVSTARRQPQRRSPVTLPPVSSLSPTAPPSPSPTAIPLPNPIPVRPNQEETDELLDVRKTVSPTIVSDVVPGPSGGAFLLSLGTASPAVSGGSSARRSVYVPDRSRQVAVRHPTTHVQHMLVPLDDLQGRLRVGRLRTGGCGDDARNRNRRHGGDWFTTHLESESYLSSMISLAIKQDIQQYEYGKQDLELLTAFLTRVLQPVHTLVRLGSAEDDGTIDSKAQPIKLASLSVPAGYGTDFNANLTAQIQQRISLLNRIRSLVEQILVMSSNIPSV